MMVHFRNNKKFTSKRKTITKKNPENILELEWHLHRLLRLSFLGSTEKEQNW
jgi:hypothetical protein